MDDIDTNILTNKNIPASVRAVIAEKFFSNQESQENRALDRERIRSERLKTYLNAPLVVALTGLLTLSATYLVEHFTRQDVTKNTITLEQLKTELSARDQKLKSDLQLISNENLAKLEAEAKEREFQYEIVRKELADDEKSNADRAAILLFLAKAGVLTQLNTQELEKMAKEQIEFPEKNIVPVLKNDQSESFGDNPGRAKPVSSFPNKHPIRNFVKAVGELRFEDLKTSANEDDTTPAGLVRRKCTATLLTQQKIATSIFCKPTEHAANLNFRIESNDDVQSTTLFRSRSTVAPDSIETHEKGTGNEYITMRLVRPITGRTPLRLAQQRFGAYENLGSRFGVISATIDGHSAIWNDPKCTIAKVDNRPQIYGCRLHNFGANVGSPIIDLDTGSVVGFLADQRHSGLAGLLFGLFSSGPPPNEQ